MPDHSGVCTDPEMPKRWKSWNVGMGTHDPRLGAYSNRFSGRRELTGATNRPGKLNKLNFSVIAEYTQFSTFLDFVKRLFRT